jgi:uncharacterized membrane protein YqaE (UPF0057 family)
VTMDSLSFAVNGLQIAVIALWIAGIVCACWATRYLKSRKSRLLLLVLAVFFPPFGSIAVMVRFTVLVRNRRRPALAANPHR